MKAHRFSAVHIRFLRAVLILCIVLSATPTTGTIPADQEHNLRENTARSLNALGLYYYDRQQFVRAAETFERALEYDSGNAAARTNLAISYLQQGQFKKVIETLGESNQSDQRVVTALAVSYFGLGQYQESAKYYEQLAQMVPEDLVLRLTLAATLALSGNVERAQSVLSQTPKDASVQAQYHVILGDAYRTQMKAAEAIAEYDQALSLDPTIKDVNYRIGVLYSDTNAWDKAVAAFQKELSVNPQSAEANYSLGAYFLSASSDLDKARLFFKKAIELNEGHLGAYLGLMKIDLSAKQASPALEWARQAEAHAGENEELHYLKSRAFAMLGQTAEASKELERFQELKAK